MFFIRLVVVLGGHGIVFNPGEPEGEGFTCWVWLLLAFFQYIGVQKKDGERFKNSGT